MEIECIMVILLYYRSKVDHNAMKDCLIREVQSILKMSSIHRVTSIYFGGGNLACSYN